MIKIALASLIAVVAVTGVWVPPASAARTVTCESRNNRYKECRADFRSPVIVRKKSDSPCIRNRTWGFERRHRTIWVDNGCRAIFAEGRKGWHDRDDDRDDHRGDYRNDY